MGLERRGWIKRSHQPKQLETGGPRWVRQTSRSTSIRSKKLVYEAYKAVKSNGGAAGVDGQTIEQFEEE